MSEFSSFLSASASGSAPARSGSVRGRLAGAAQSLRFSGFTVLAVVLLVLGVFIVSPNVSAFVEQRQQIRALEREVQTRQQLFEATAKQQNRWKDPNYVRAQARARLFYVVPGEVQLNVIADVPVSEEGVTVPSEGLTRIDNNWARLLALSFVEAGFAVPSPVAEPGPAPEGQELLGSPEEAPADVALLQLLEGGAG